MGSAAPPSRLFEPLKIGSIVVSHRIAMAPLTRHRVYDDGVIMPMAQEYYGQRSRAVPGTLLITEGVTIAPYAGGYRNSPGIWADAQVAAWKEVTARVHEAGSHIFCQILGFGRGAVMDVVRDEGIDFVSSSATPIDDRSPIPRALREDEIRQYVQDFVGAAKRAMEAGFDGVEVDGANGFLIDQFIQDTCNKRTDIWGGSVENRSRFALEITKAVVNAIGADKTGFRMSPWSRHQGMRMADLVPQFTHLIKSLRDLNLAYLHLVGPRTSGDGEYHGVLDDVHPLVDLWSKPSVVLLAGGFSPESAKEAVDYEHTDVNLVVAFGRHFIPNPDLVWRIKNGVSLRKYDRKTFYDAKNPVGYIDYEFCDEWKEQHCYKSGEAQYESSPGDPLSAPA